MMAPLAPALLARVAIRHGGSLPGLAVLELTPPSTAATAMANPAHLSAWLGLLLLIGWSVGLGGVLIAVERLPLHSRTIAGAPADWDHPCDRIAAVFGARLAPLAGKVLRYYVRSPVRYNYLFILPAVAVFIHGESPGAAFMFAVGAAPAIGFASTIPIAMNLFGFDGHGLRRYFLLPVSGAQVFRTVALVSLIPGVVLIPIGLVAWVMFAPVHTDGRMITMLLSSGLAGLLFFSSLGLWTTLLSPRAIPFEVKFGNKLSFAANLLMFVTWGVLFGLPWVLKGLGFETVVGAWWVTPLFLVGAAALYMATLRSGATVFVARRERILALIEDEA